MKNKRKLKDYNQGIILISKDLGENKAVVIFASIGLILIIIGF